MTSDSLPRLRLPVWLRCCAFIALLVSAAFAQVGAGRVTGRVFNPAKG